MVKHFFASFRNLLTSPAIKSICVVTSLFVVVQVTSSCRGDADDANNSSVASVAGVAGAEGDAALAAAVAAGSGMQVIVVDAQGKTVFTKKISVNVNSTEPSKLSLFYGKKNGEVIISESAATFINTSLDPAEVDSSTGSPFKPILCSDATDLTCGGGGTKE
jgi:hypothetical protein